MIRESTFDADFALVVGHAESLTGHFFEVFRADTGRPGHITLPISSLKRAPILFHAGQVGYVGYLSSVAWSRLLGENVDVADMSRRICLRLLADHLLCVGNPTAAIASIARAKEDEPLWSSFDAMRYRAPSELVEAQEAQVVPEQYIPMVFEGLAHEFGHHVDGRLREAIEGHPCLQPAAIVSAVRQNIQFFKEGRKKMPVPSDLVGQEHLHVQEYEALVRNSAEAWAERLRTEIIADLAGLSILWQACVDSVRSQNRRAPSPSYFAVQMVVTTIALLITYGVGMSARRFESAEIRGPEDILEVWTSIGTRMRILFELFFRDGGDLRWLGIEASMGGGGDARLIEAVRLADDMCLGLLAADEQAKSSDFIDRELVERFVERRTAFPHFQADRWAFSRLADDLELVSPELNRMRELRGDPTRFEKHF